MSYNTRRSGNMGNQPSPASAVGQRRPPPLVTNNFVPGGQLNLNNQGNYPNQQRQQQNFAGQQLRAPQPNQQFQQQKLQAQQQTQQQLPQQQQQPPKVQQQQQQPEQKILIQSEQKFVPLENAANNDTSSVDQPMPLADSAAQNADGAEKKPKPFWLKNASKISRKEKVRRRNKRLVKFLQPKNAVMVLNEMVGNSTYTLSENTEQIGDGLQFKASVLVDGIEHFGYGKSKMAAKSSAAETAIRFLVLKRLKSGGQTTTSITSKVESGEDVNMEETADDPTLPWQHVASFALHKLFSTWDEGGKITERLVTSASATTTDGAAVVPEKKPAKKMPPNPEQMNPIMLLNQMVPHAEYIELSKAGNPPNIVFTYKCSANGKSFIGRGSNKKQAKKMCAYEACRTLLDVEYPPEAFAPYQSYPNQAERMQVA